MADETLTPAQQALKEQMAREKLAAQYRSVFGFPPAPGQPDTRSPAQIAVWQDLEIAGYFRKPIFVPDRVGALCPLRAAYAEGRRSIFLYAEANVTFAPSLGAQPQQ